MTDDSQSQTLRAILGLRGLIVDGELPPGARVSEAIIVERLGVSRTPARVALLRMKEQGFLNESAGGAFSVAAFTQQELFDAIEIRGTLEGMAARYAAERGISAALGAKMQACVDALDEIVAEVSIDIDAFVVENDRFHDCLIEASSSKMVRRSIERITALPFASPNAFVASSRSDNPHVHSILIVAQDQHRTILEAINRRQGARAQALAIEHSFQATKYLRAALVNDARPSLPALKLITG